jgi:hypothetical protein
MAEVLGVSRQRAARLQWRQGFPEPVVFTIEGEPLWRKDHLERWNRERHERNAELGVRSNVTILPTGLNRAHE